MLLSAHAGRVFPLLLPYPAVRFYYPKKDGLTLSGRNIMKERRDIWKELKPLVENTVNSAFEKYIPKIVEECRRHDEIMIMKHEIRNNNKRNFAIWGVVVTACNTVLAVVIDKFR